MKSAIRMTMLVCAAVAAASDVSSAQAVCPEGRVASGQCVDPGLAGAMRETAVIFSQPKISQTAFPILPSPDSQYRYPHELIPTPLRPSATGAPAPN